MTLDVLATEVHFADHLASVYLALPPEHRGLAIAHEAPNKTAVRDRFASHGIAAVGGPLTNHERPILVAAIGSLRIARRMGRRHVALMEHGAGQSYGGSIDSAKHPSYAGGLRRDADLFLHPGPHPAGRDRRAYPDARVEVVGSPFVDVLPSRITAATDDGKPVIAIAGHFDATISPEAGSGFGWATPGFVRLARSHQVIGTGHPQIIDRLAYWYRRRNVEVVRDFREVLRRADVYVADNTSGLFLFAATGRPVVVLNPPGYRMTVNHGLRFEPSRGCEITPGIHFCGAAHVGIAVNDPLQIAAAVDRALEYRPADIAAREAALDLVYTPRHGAAARAAEVLVDWMASCRHQVDETALEATA